MYARELFGGSYGGDWLYFFGSPYFNIAITEGEYN